MSWWWRIRRAIRRRARLIAVETLCRLALTDRHWRCRDNAAKVQVLLLHGLRDDEQDQFRNLLRHLSPRYHFIGYSEAVRRIVTGDVDRPYLALSFDDGLHGCWAAASILEEFGTRGMFFVCPGIIEADKRQQHDFCRERLWMEPRRFLSWTEIENLASRGHEFGSHTLNHVNMNQISADELSAELIDAKRALVAKLGACDHFAWPYGRYWHFSELGQQLVTHLGFSSCASGERGSHAAHSRRLDVVPCIRRESIEVSWPVRHVKFFLERSGKSPLTPNECWPSEWHLASLKSVVATQRVA